MWQYVDSADSVVAIINRAVPYYVAGVAVAIGFKMNLFNIGVDGQYRLAALLAAAAGAAVTLPAPLHVAVHPRSSPWSSARAYAAIAGVLKVTRGVNEVVSTIMLNFIATGITRLPAVRRTSGTTSVNLASETKPLPRSGWLPSLNRLLELDRLPPADGHGAAGLPASSPSSSASSSTSSSTAPASASTCARRASTRAAALASGVNPKAMIMKTIMLSGASPAWPAWARCCPTLHKYGDTFPTAIGFTGIAVALLGRNSPVGIAIAAVVWAGIERAGAGPCHRSACPRRSCRSCRARCC